LAAKPRSATLHRVLGATLVTLGTVLLVAMGPSRCGCAFS